MEKLLSYIICLPSEKGKEGSYGVVKKAIERESKKIVAIKFLKTGISQEGLSCSAIRQIAVLKELDGHQNIIRLRETIFNQRKLYLVFDFIDYNLSEFTKTFEINQYLIKKFLAEILSAVAFAHSRRIMHRDLKPQNIMVRMDHPSKIPKIQIADWGISRIFFQKRQRYTKTVVSFPYRAPEILLGQGDYKQSIDIWSIGCIFAQISSKKRLFQSHSQIAQLINIVDTLGLPNDLYPPLLHKLNEIQGNFNISRHQPSLRQKMSNLNESGLNLLKMMLEINPERRISAQDALNHDYFKKVE